MIKISYDRRADVADFRLAEGPVDQTEETAPGIGIDFTADGQVLGFRIGLASKRVIPAAMAELMKLECRARELGS